MRLYLDLCCLNRPFDEQRQSRVRLETQAVMHILELCREGRHSTTTSTALEVENGRTPNPERRQNVNVLLNQAQSHVDHTPEIDGRAAALVALGFGSMDALHVAYAETGACDRLVTTDDQFLKCGSRNAQELKVTVTNPVQLVAEVEFL